MRKNIISVVAAMAVMPAVSFAAAPTLSDVLDASGISITGHASGSWAYNHIGFDNSSGGGSASVNQFTFDQAELTVSKLPTEGFGALVDVYAGQDVSGGTYNYTDIVTSLISSPSGIGIGGPQNILPTSSFNHFGAAAGAGTSEFNLHQAYVQYATGGLTVIGGKFATLAGFEVASDALNTNATRSILFSQQAFTLTGVRAGYKFNNLVTAYAGLSNAVVPPALPFIIPGLTLPNTVDYNPQKTVELGVALAPIKNLTVSLTDYRGTEGVRVLGGGGIDLKTNLLDAVVAYTIGDLSLAYNFDYNTSKNSDGSSNAKFLGHALYANYQITPKVRAGVRGELTSAWDSVVGGPKIKRNEVTLTGVYSASKSFDLISDVRYAGVQNDTVLGGGTPVNAHQLGYVLKAVYKF